MGSCIPGGAEAPGPVLESINNKPLVSMRQAFHCAYELVKVPTIPSSVTNIEGLLYQCGNVTGEITIKANPTAYRGWAGDTTKPIVLTGTSTMLEELAKAYDHVTVKGQ